MENLDQLEVIIDNSEDLKAFIIKRALNTMGRCGKMVFAALMTAEQKEMTVSEITELVNNVFGVHWTNKNIKCFLERLELIGLVNCSARKWRMSYKLNKTKDLP